ncbi:hypothetical protein QO010_000641 [Caulobacter ginsengisoli]|uniref:Nucleoside 2-deoxyribosyltransferase n=1 Tax=Caulobacter ginsengisoli TaxID=400775 RepID=A0ABU0ILJ6_9CAUL|nr:hypothetical protein [Caulobacter ginsengisoli]MDQ0462893.1 hypothetical protein [Caulobacter ginsengisoli]
MKIAICGSMSFIDEMEAIAADLRAHVEAVFTPVREEGDLDWDSLPLEQAVDRKRGYLLGYLEQIRACDGVLIANFEKHGVAGYVGPNTLVEAAFAHAAGKPVAFLNPPGPQPARLEALAMMTICLDGGGAAIPAWAAGLAP